MTGFSDNVGDQSVNLTIQAMQDVAKEEAQELNAEQLDSKSAFLQSQEEAINPFAAKFATKQKKVENHRGRIAKMMQMGEKGQRLLPIERIKDTAQQFQKRNPELKSNVLTTLREQIKPDDTMEEILRKVQEFYPDASLADEALEFLLETTDGELARKVMEAKQTLNKEFGREIAAGKNVSNIARQASEKGIGTPTSLRDLYRDITGNPRDSTTLFEELAQKYAFKDLKKVIDFMLHGLGADMKSKGPSIAKGMLHRLLAETRSLQAILGVYRFFRGRMRLMEKMFLQENLKLPAQMNFETMAKEFMAMCSDRYPSSAKVLQHAERLGIEKWIMAKIIAFSQFRDAIREVAMNLIFKSLQHRDELYLAILEALEDLEDELEELEEKDEEEDEGKGKKKKADKDDEEE